VLVIVAVLPPVPLGDGAGRGSVVSPNPSP
jgi:hypothetical protein